MFKRRNLFIGIWLLICLLYVSCASFPKQHNPGKGLSLNTLKQLEGDYRVEHYTTKPTKDSTAVWNFSEPDLGRYPTLFDEINNGLFVKEFRVDPEKTYCVSIHSVTNQKLRMYYYENNILIKQNTLRFRLKDDGYLYLRYRNFKIIGLPYLLGGIKLKRNRITLDDDHNLVFETSEVTSGGVILLFVFNPVFKSKYEKIYQRIE